MSSEVSTPSPRPRPWRALSALAFAAAGAVLVTAMVLQRTPGTARRPQTAATAAPSAVPAAPHALEPDQIRAMAQRLAERLARQPDDADGWAMLARTHALSGEHAQAVLAFRKAEALRPADAVLLADFADALAMTQQRRLAGEPLQLVQRALAVDPKNLKALSLAGTEAFDRGDHAAAVRHWQALQVAGGPDSVFVQQVQGGLAEARQKAGLVGPGGAVKVTISRGPGS